MAEQRGSSRTPDLPNSVHSLPGVEWILDPDRLLELFRESPLLAAGPDTSLGTSYLRFKPGVSAVARVDVGEPQAIGSPADRESSEPGRKVPASKEPAARVLWVATYGPATASKATKAMDRARRLYGDRAGDGLEVRELPNHPGHVVVLGRIAVDPKLAEAAFKVLGPQAFTLGSVGSSTKLLRFNPHRRIVLTNGLGETVAKITAESSSVDPELLEYVAGTGVPVQTPQPCPDYTSSSRLRCYRWFGDGDLSEILGEGAGNHPSAADDDLVVESAQRAGAALFDLHDCLRQMPSELRDRIPPAVDPVPRLRAMGQDFRTLDDALADRFEALAQRLGQPGQLGQPEQPGQGDGHVVLLHGDFSADQVLLDTQKLRPDMRAGSFDWADTSARQDAEALRITDLDRFRTGSAADDLGNMRSVDLLSAPLNGAGTGAADAIMQGYRTRAASGAPEEGAVRAWTVYHLLCRSMTPFRDCSPTWRAECGAILDLAQRTLDGPGGQDAVPATVTHHGRSMTVKRAWPKSDGRLSAELLDVHGRVRAAVAHPEIDAQGAAIPHAMRWKVSPFGVDSKLPGLEDLAQQGTLVVHRRGRRAVVALPDRYVKLLAPGKAENVANLSRQLHELGTAAGFAVPAVLRHGSDRVEFAILPGESLHALGAAGDAASYRAGITAWATAWPALVRSVTEPTEALPAYTARDETVTLTDWAQRLAAFPGVLGVDGRAFRRKLEDLTHRLGEIDGDTAGRGVVHRDLHEKQLLVDGERVGLLDFDTAAVGEPALDLANLSVHLDLHRSQGVLSDELHAFAQERIEDVARELDVAPRRLETYRDSTRLRLVCVYAFRPRWRGLARDWATQLLT